MGLRRVTWKSSVDSVGQAAAGGETTPRWSRAEGRPRSSLLALSVCLGPWSQAPLYPRT